MEGRGRLCGEDAAVYGAGGGDGVWGLAGWGWGCVVDWSGVVSVGEAVGARGWDGGNERGFPEMIRIEFKAHWRTGGLAVALVSMGPSRVDG